MLRNPYMIFVWDGNTLMLVSICLFISRDQIHPMMRLQYNADSEDAQSPKQYNLAVMLNVRSIFMGVRCFIRSFMILSWFQIARYYPFFPFLPRYPLT